MVHRSTFIGLGAVVCLAVSGACESDPQTIEVAVTLGRETGALEGIDTVEVSGLDESGEVVVRGSAPPGGAIELGEVTTDVLLTFEVRGSGPDAEVRGRSLGVLAGGLDGDVLPLFAQRLGSFARPPGALSHAHVGGVAGVIGERWILSTGGTHAIAADGAEADPAEADFYDLLGWGGAESTALPRRALSLVTRGTAALVIDDLGASWFDFDSGSSFEAEAPAAVSFTLVAGGMAIDTSDGSTFVLGATRSPVALGDAPTDQILHVAADGQLAAAVLAVPRAGAAATWVADLGLVVAGGSAAGAGVEVLAEGAEAARLLPFDVDPTDGAALVALGGRSVLRVGGLLDGAPAPTVVLDLACGEGCVPDVLLEASALPLLTAVRGFATPSGALVLGTDDQGLVRAFVIPLDGTLPIETPLREPRRGAAVVAAPNGTLAVMGGQLVDGSPALHVETWFPE